MKSAERILNLAPTRWTMAIGWSLLLTLFLLQPEADPIIDLGLPRGDSTLAREAFFSGLHLLAFAVTCALWFYALRGGSDRLKPLLAALGIAIVLGVITEALQSLTLDRYPSFIDLLANIAGALFAARLIWSRGLPRLPR